MLLLFRLQYHYECYCDNVYARLGILDDSLCNSECDGNPSQKCGGKDALSVYSGGELFYQLFFLDIIKIVLNIHNSDSIEECNIKWN